MFGCGTALETTPLERFRETRLSRQNAKRFCDAAFGRSADCPIHSNRITSIAWSHDGGKRMACASSDRSISIAVLSKDRLTRETTMTGHMDRIESVMWGPADSCVDEIASVGYDKLLKLWDSRTQKCSRTLQTKNSLLHSAWSRDGQLIALLDHNDVITFYDRKAGKVTHTIDMNAEITWIEWHPTHRNLLYLGTGNGHLMQYEYGTSQPRQVGPGQNSITSLQFDPQQRYVVVSDASGCITFYDYKTLLIIETIDTGMYSLEKLSLSPTGDLIVCMNSDALVNVFYAGWNQPLLPNAERTIRKEEDCRDIAWHPKYHFFAAATGNDSSYYNQSRSSTSPMAGTVKIVGGTRERWQDYFPTSSDQVNANNLAVSS